ncbi:hypothetical protein CC80DRAFT_426686 [Byssothecium circinans]|uniref:DUF6594 domain-containing protein n=1 Tax=Byssothecium circinans TaxID=147558 RepID=A0A6A5TDV5_9PLEO|nr:hypothetical protein CC80DRAFT_426686 [Byssothecium circinans]
MSTIDLTPLDQPGTAASETPGLHHAYEDLVQGYPKLAGRMGAMPEVAMFRRFGALNCRNLLYLQSELVELENKLRRLEYEDSQSTVGDKRFFARDHWLLMASTQMKDGVLRSGDTKQLDLVRQIRGVLKEYNTAIIQQAQIIQMGKPDNYDIQDIQKFLVSDHMIPKGLLGPDREIWGTFNDTSTMSKELICLRPRQDADSFSRFTGAHVITFLQKFGFARWMKKDERFGALAVRTESIFRFTFWVTSLIASAMPVISIVVLIKLKALTARLATIAAFNALLSICLTVFSDAKRTDVFAVTAA